MARLTKPIRHLTQPEVRVGMPVRYWPVLKNGRPQHGVDPIATRVRAMPWQLGDGTWVCSVEGKAGGVSLEHLEAL